MALKLGENLDFGAFCVGGYTFTRNSKDWYSVLQLWVNY